MKELRRVWVIEEATDAVTGEIGQRQTMGTTSLHEDGQWSWDRPDDRLTPKQQAEWDRVMKMLQNVNGEDLRHVVCFAGLLDHCQRPESIKNYG